jgi:thermitase
VAAAGNDGTNRRNYPAAYPEVLAVAVTNSADRRASFSSYGRWVDVSAPGVDILSTYPGGYKRLTGTSMASPEVASLAGLLAGEGLTEARIRSRILHTAKDRGPAGRDPRYEAGRIDAAAATSK